MPEPERLGKAALAAELQRELEAARQLRLARAADPDAADHLRLRAWQSARLARSHADLLGEPRHAAAARFFLDELYGTHDFSERDAQLARVLPRLVAALPERALATLVDALALDALSESLDADMVVQLRRSARIADLDGPAYAAAYRTVGRPDDRARQIALTGRIGHTLDQLTRLPLLGGSLRLMRRPAELAGLGGLHHFLQTGYDAFRSMHGADAFLARVVQRETALMQRLFDGGLPD